MFRILLITAGLCCCMAASAQFHTVTPHTARYRIERVEQGTAGKTTEVTEKAATEDLPADTASMRKQWIDSYLSVSYPLKEVHVTSPFGIRTDPFTKKRKRHNGLDLRADRCETYAMMHGIVVKTRTGQGVREICYRAARGLLGQLLPSVGTASEEG